MREVNLTILVHTINACLVWPRSLAGVAPLLIWGPPGRAKYRASAHLLSRQYISGCIWSIIFWEVSSLSHVQNMHVVLYALLRSLPRGRRTIARLRPFSFETVKPKHKLALAANIPAGCRVHTGSSALACLNSARLICTCLLACLYAHSVCRVLMDSMKYNLVRLKYCLCHYFDEFWKCEIARHPTNENIIDHKWRMLAAWLMTIFSARK